MDMFAEYIKERENKSVYQTEHGFAVYQISGTECYIQDIFIKEQSRNKDNAREIADAVCEIAKSNGCKTLTGTVAPSLNGSTKSLGMLLHYGFKLHSCREDFIILVKEI